MMTEWIMTQSINTTGHEWIIVFLSYTTLHSIFASVLLLCMNHTSLSHIFPFSLWLIQQFYNSVLFAARGFDWHIICRLFHLTTLRYFVMLANTSTLQVLQSRSVFPFYYYYNCFFFKVRAAWFFKGFIAFKESSWISTRVGLRKPELTGAEERSTSSQCCQL